MNKYSTPNKSNLAVSQLNKILENIYRARTENSNQTTEAYITEANRLLSIFQSTISKIDLGFQAVVAETSPDLDQYNSLFQTLKDNLEITFTELESLEGVVLENFNLFITTANRLNNKVQQLNNKTIDYALFAQLPIQNSIFFTDNFTDPKVEYKSPLLNSLECYINSEEGIVTLPLESSKVIEVKLNPVINSASNGRTGNNEEIGAVLNPSILAILDSNEDTWFEYERVVLQDDYTPLILDLTINLSNPEIINFIRINPNNFGAKTEINIIDITTSEDGLLYKSIKDNYNSLDKLAPSTSKYAGQGLFTFLPRRAKYLRFTLQQTTPYLINTVRGSQFRYAIGIRDIEIKRQTYGSVGELISTSFTTSFPVRKIALKRRSFPQLNTEFFTIKHELSLDEGSTWFGINPLDDEGVINMQTENVEILNINTDTIGSKHIEPEPFLIRHKIKLERIDENINDQSFSLAEEIRPYTELKSVPQTEPWTLNLDHTPIPHSISIIDPSYGSRGLDRRYLIGRGTGTAATFTLPDILPTELEKTSGVKSYNSAYKIYVNNEEYTEVPTLVGADSTDKVFAVSSKTTAINLNSRDAATFRSLRFGNGTEGFAPPEGSIIELGFNKERIYPVDKDIHLVYLDYPTAKDKSQVRISSTEGQYSNTAEMAINTNIHRLKNRNIIINSENPIKFFPANQTIFTNRLGFSNGKIAPLGELLAPGDYSVDTETGIVYSYSPPTAQITSAYVYELEIDLLPTEWNFVNNSSQEIEIENSAFKPINYPNFLAEDGINVIELPETSIKEGSLTFIPQGTVSAGDNPFSKEVPFLDGTTELKNAVQKVFNISTLNPTANIANFTLATSISSNQIHKFSNFTYFNVEVAALINLDAPGKYHINYTTGVVSVYITSVTENPGTLTYWTEQPFLVPEGAYSINYVTGTIYTQKLLPVDYLINFSYSKYYIRYNIARLVDPENWEIDLTSQTRLGINGFTVKGPTITINPAEVKLKTEFSGIGSVNNNSSNNYQISYNYVASNPQNIEELIPFLSPVLFDYTLQVVTSESL